MWNRSSISFSMFKILNSAEETSLTNSIEVPVRASRVPDNNQLDFAISYGNNETSFHNLESPTWPVPLPFFVCLVPFKSSLYIICVEPE